MPPAMTAAMVEMRMSRCFDVGELVGDDAFEFGGPVIICMRPSVTADDAGLGPRPVAKALGSLLVGEVEAGHGGAGADGEAFDDFVEFGGLDRGETAGWAWAAARASLSLKK